MFLQSEVQSVINEFQASLISFFSSPHRNRSLKNKLYCYDISVNDNQISESSNDANELAISFCKLSNSMLLNNYLHFQKFIESIMTINHKICYLQGGLEVKKLSQEDADKYIMEKDHLQKKTPLIKILPELQQTVFGLLQTVIRDFGEGYKLVVSEIFEEKLYHEVSKILMCQLNSAGKFVRQSFEACKNKMYSNLIALAVVFENRLLREFLNNKSHSSLGRKTTPLPYESPFDLSQGIQLKCLSFTICDYNKEELEYNDEELLQCKQNRGEVAGSHHTTPSTTDNMFKLNEVEETYIHTPYETPLSFYQSFHAQNESENFQVANQHYSQQNYTRIFYSQFEKLSHSKTNENNGRFYDPSLYTISNNFQRSLGDERMHYAGYDSTNSLLSHQYQTSDFSRHHRHRYSIKNSNKYFTRC